MRVANILAVLDIGSSKTVCLIARCDAGVRKRRDEAFAGLRIIGCSATETLGMRRGTAVDMPALERTVQRTIDAAEAAADVTIDKLLISVAAGSPKGAKHTVAADIGRPIIDRDVENLTHQAINEFDRQERHIVHALPSCFTVDGMSGIVGLRGMRADRLNMDMLFVTAEAAPLKNISLCVERCHVDSTFRVITPYASALGVLSDEEKNSGAICLDMGADLTCASVFAGGRLQHVDTVRLGGSDITRDIANIFVTPFAAAEAVKKKSGAALRWSSDERETIEMPVPGDHEEDYPVMARIPRARLNDVIRPRAEEILECMRDQLRQSGYGNQSGDRLILTGGAAQLPGMAEAAAALFGRRPRIGSPAHIPDMPDTKRGPAYAAAVGLLLYAASPPEEVLPAALLRTNETHKGRLQRIFKQIKEYI